MARAPVEKRRMTRRLGETRGVDQVGYCRTRRGSTVVHGIDGCRAT